MQRQDIRGRIAYLDLARNQTGSEWFSVSRFPDGSRTARCECHFDDVGLVRDVTLTLGPDWRPVDAYLRIHHQGRSLGAGWFHFAADAVTCHSIDAEGRPQQHGRAHVGPIPAFGAHPILNDGFWPALFDLSRFTDAKAAFTRALVIQPDDAYTHQMLGLTLEQLGETKAADAELARALALAPTELTAPILISVAEFQTEIDAVVASLPAERKAKVKAIKIEIAELPDPTDLAAVKPPFPPTILGLYRGPVGRLVRLPPPPGEETPSIVLYRKNLARAVKTRRELSEQIRDTLLHEIGHLEGLDEDDLRRRGME